MMSVELPSSFDEYKKLLKEYSQYSANLKNYLYEYLTSIMGQSPPQWLFEIVYKDAHSPLIYWMKEKPGIMGNDHNEDLDGEKESIEDIILEYGLVKDGPIIRIGEPISSAQLQELKARLRQNDYEFLDSKGVFRPKWNGVKK